MKRVILFLTVILCFTVLLVSCGGDTTNDSTQGSTTNSTPASQQSGGNGDNGGTGGNGDNGGNGSINVENTANTSYGTVTKEEWVKAFELDGVNSFTVTFNEEDDLNGEKDVYSGVTKYSNGVIYNFYTENNTERKTEYGKDEAWDAINNGSRADCYQESLEILYNFSDYNYDGFTYSDGNKCYEYRFERGDDDSKLVIEIQVYFGSDKRISKVVSRFEERSTYEGKEDFSIFTSTVEYKDYNSTSISMPTSDIKASIDNLFKPYITNSSECYVSVAEALSDEETKTIFINIINSIDLNDVEEYVFRESGAKDTFVSIDASLGGATCTIDTQEYTCSSIYIELDDDRCYINLYAVDSYGNNQAIFSEFY